MSGLSVRQWELLARIRDRHLVWRDVDLHDDDAPGAAALPIHDLEAVGDLAERDLVLDGLTRPMLTELGEDLMATDTARPEAALSPARGVLIAVVLALGVWGLLALLVWLVTL